MRTLKYRIGALAIVGLLSSGEFRAACCVAQESSAKEASKTGAAKESPEEVVSEASSENSLSAEKSEKKNRGELTEEQRAAAMNFAEENHPELARLLDQLQKSRPHESARALKELTQQIQALERLREKTPARYSSHLEAWKHESQIRVLMARWAKNKDAELETQIRELLKARRVAKLAQLRTDKERLIEQQKKIEQQLAALDLPVDEMVDKEWEQLSKKAGARKNGGKKDNPVTETITPSPEANAADAAVQKPPE